MGQALYRKYRSKTLSEIVGQEHITTTLNNALKQGRISHAYLFTGPRGVGKTSIARILAHEVNGLKYDSEGNHLDIIEIDAASNRRIDEIRELRERVHTAPASSKYKVYIIDEVHMLTREAFNALLKTLEEPPTHAIFILATTESHKLPETIISRTQRFTFKPIDVPSAVNHLEAIAKLENIDITRDALKLIAEHGDGSFRDSIGLLDQVSGIGRRITIDDVQTTLGVAPSQVIDDILTALKSGDLDLLVSRLAKLREQGYQASHVAKQVSSSLRNDMISGNHSLEPETLKTLLRDLLEVPASHDPDGLLELVLLSAATTKNNSATIPKSEDTPASSKKPADKPKSQAAKVTPVIVDKVEKEVSPPVSSTGKLDESTWHNALATLKQQYNTLHGVARMASPRFDGTTLYLAVAFPFHKKRLDDAKNKQIITDVVRKTSGVDIMVVCELDSKQKPTISKTEETKPVSDETIASISNIFGSVEMLE